MVEVVVTYEGKLHTTASHGPSGATLATDAPKDNEGLGEAFSPTDLVATALGACMLSVMGIYARRHNLALEGAKATVHKHMVADPVRRIGTLEVVIEMPAGLAPETRAVLERVAHTCPVHRSLHPDVQTPIVFRYPD